MNILRGCIGILSFLFLAWLLSENRRRLEWRIITWGLALQFAFALLLLYVPPCQILLQKLNRLVHVLYNASAEGASFVFGWIAGGDPPFLLKNGLLAPPEIFFFGPLMMLILVGALSAILFHLRILQRIVALFAALLRKTMGIDGATGVAAAANILLGQSDAPLLIKPYIARLSRPGLFCVMVAGMTTISGSLMVVYAKMLDPILPGLVIGHLVIASLISAPAALLLARLMIPEPTSTPTPIPTIPPQYPSLLDALFTGAADGAKVMVNVAIMLVAVIACVSLLNSLFHLLPLQPPLTLERLFGWIMAPLMWLAGVPWHEARAAGELMALKTVFNEFVAYARLSQIPPETFSLRSRLILLYALCGFSNFSSIGILTGTLGSLAPERRHEVVALGFKAVAAATLATLLTGTIIGMISPP